ncbi:NusA-like transcription termination signal-binding factor [Candidatus Woesearchaeota archaeon]|nr:NusA-like transcription termination signal-binding factor [Candidatus Woesearchaeota archaeon]
MARRTFDINSLKYISLFESLTGARVKDCIISDNVTFIIEKGNIGLAIGRQGKTLRRVEKVFQKRLKIVEFDDNVLEFIKNFIYPIRKIGLSREGSVIKIKGHDTKTRAMVIGRERSRLKRLESVVKRYFDIEKIVVE